MDFGFFRISRARLWQAAFPFALGAAVLDLVGFLVTGTGGLLTAVIVGFLVKAISEPQAHWTVSAQGISDDVKEIGWDAVSEVQIDQHRSVYQRMRVGAADGRVLTIAVGLLDDRAVFEEAIRSAGGDSLVCSALESPGAHPFRDPGIGHSVLIISLLAVAMVALPYAAWIVSAMKP